MGLAHPMNASSKQTHIIHLGYEFDKGLVRGRRSGGMPQTGRKLLADLGFLHHLGLGLDHQFNHFGTNCRFIGL